MPSGIVSRYILQDHLATEVARLYSNEFKEPFFVAVGSHEPFDIASATGNMKIELKFESTPVRTGNVAIEFWNTDLDAPSAILGTKATHWLHIVPEGTGLICIEHNVDRLRRLVVEAGVVKWNGRNSLCKIIPLETFKKHAKRCFVFHSRFYSELMASTGAVVERSAA